MNSIPIDLTFVETYLYDFSEWSGMFDWSGIYVRFFEAYEVKRSSELARLLGVTKQTAHSWKVGKSNVPWRRMKKLIDEKGINWDWLIEGHSPKCRSKQKFDEHNELNWNEINNRFLELFLDKRQHVIAGELDVSQETVSKWHRKEMNVPWEKLKYATDRFKISWNWLIEGWE